MTPEPIKRILRNRGGKSDLRLMFECWNAALEEAAGTCEDEARLRDNQAAATRGVENRNIIIASHNTAYELAAAIRALRSTQEGEAG